MNNSSWAGILLLAKCAPCKSCHSGQTCSLHQGRGYALAAAGHHTPNLGLHPSSLLKGQSQYSQWATCFFQLPGEKGRGGGDWVIYQTQVISIQGKSPRTAGFYVAPKNWPLSFWELFSHYTLRVAWVEDTSWSVKKASGSFQNPSWCIGYPPGMTGIFWNSQLVFQKKDLPGYPPVIKGKLK